MKNPLLKNSPWRFAWIDFSQYRRHSGIITGQSQTKIMGLPPCKDTNKDHMLMNGNGGHGISLMPCCSITLKTVA